MSQLPWGGRPTSPTNDVSGTGPGQNATAGPEANAERCDCTCPDYGELPWLPPGDGGPPGGDPDYEGVYYRLIRCRDDADQPAWVQANEFSPGDVLLIETDGVQTCFYVDTEEVANDQVQDTNVVRPADVVTDFATCNACRTSGPPGIVDPDPPLPPILPTSYAQLAFCSDDTLAPLWTPVEVFGVPVAEDLTKIYKIEGVCYYISNNIQPTPGGPLMPVFGADVFDTCIECAPPCTDCDPGGAGNDPKLVTVAGIGAGADCTNGTENYDSFDTDNSTYCEWKWSGGGAPAGASLIVLLRYATAGFTWTIGGCSVALVAGEWAIHLEENNNVDAWMEKTTGFSCDPATGRVSGTHTYAAGPCDFFGGAPACGGTPTVTVDP